MPVKNLFCRANFVMFAMDKKVFILPIISNGLEGDAGFEKALLEIYFLLNKYRFFVQRIPALVV